MLRTAHGESTSTKPSSVSTSPVCAHGGASSQRPRERGEVAAAVLLVAVDERRAASPSPPTRRCCGRRARRRSRPGRPRDRAAPRAPWRTGRRRRSRRPGGRARAPRGRRARPRGRAARCSSGRSSRRRAARSARSPGSAARRMPGSAQRRNWSGLVIEQPNAITAAASATRRVSARGPRSGWRRSAATSRSAAASRSRRWSISSWSRLLLAHQVALVDRHDVRVPLRALDRLHRRGRAARAAAGRARSPRRSCAASGRRSSPPPRSDPRSRAGRGTRRRRAGTPRARRSRRRSRSRRPTAPDRALQRRPRRLVGVAVEPHQRPAPPRQPGQRVLEEALDERTPCS